MAAEVASVSVEDWPVGDDFLLREAVEAGAALASIARGILPFSRAYSLADVEIRWRALLYDPNVAGPAAKRMARHILDAKPTVVPVSTVGDFRSAWTAQVAAERASRGGVDGPVDAGAGPSTPTADRSPSASKRSRRSPSEDGGDDGSVDTAARAGTQIPLAPPSFADAETAVLGMEPRPALDQVDPAARKRSRAALAASLRKIRKLEASAQAATARLATSKQALGVLQGNTAVFQITRRETVVGRSTDDQKVDVDLTEEGNASKVSRQQAFIKLRWNGEFVLRNVGKRNIMINNVAVESGRRAALAPHSLIEVGGLRLMFLPNPTLVRASEPEPF